MKFHFILARRTPDVPSRIILDVREVLRRRGHVVESSIPEETLTGLAEVSSPADLYLLKSYTELSLSLAGAIAARGDHLINPYDGCASSRNKIVCYQVLHKAKIPVPRAWVTADLSRLKGLLEQFPLILKPHMGWRGEGVTLVRRKQDLAGLPVPTSPLLIQEYIENAGEDLRIYVAGERVFGIRKRFSTQSFAIDGEPVAVTPEIRDIALRCGQAFGLRLYGLDIIEGVDGPRVVDVNYFPGYKGVPGAAYAVADCIENCVSLQSPDFQPQIPQFEVIQ